MIVQFFSDAGTVLSQGGGGEGGGTPIYKIDGDVTLKRYQVSVLWAWLECFSPQNYQFLRNTRSAVIC